MTKVDSTDVSHSHERTFFGHPWGLANLFGVEMWERFSFYGLQGILLFYLYYQTTEGGLGISEHIATAIVGAYGGMVYLAAIGGSWVADRILGSERVLFYSAILIMFGHLSLALLPAIIGLTAGLVLIAVGSGGLKTTASSVLGDLYAEGDPRRESGFSIFYMGINIGALFGPLLTGWVWGQKGFHWGFAVAAIGMAIGLIQYALMRKDTIGAVGHDIVNPLPTDKTLFGVPTAIVYAIVGILVGAPLIVLLFTTGLVKVDWLSNIVSVLATLAALILMIQMYVSPLTNKTEKQRLIGFIPMFFASVVFWSIYQQQFTVVAIYSDKRLDRTFGSFEISPTWVNAISPVFVILFAGVLATMWAKMGDRQPSTPMKYGLSMILIGLATFIFIPFAGGGANSTPFMVIVLIMFLFTMAELMISPVGLSLATRLAPEHFVTRMMCVQFLSIAVGTALAGTMAGFYNPDVASAERNYFLVMGSATIIAGALILIARKPILKAFAGER